MPAIAPRARSCLGAALFLFALASGPAASAQSGRAYFLPDNLLLSRVVYDDKRSNVVVGMQLPPGCAPANCVSAITDGTYHLSEVEGRTPSADQEGPFSAHYQRR
jgi:hypothetical protein